MTHIKTVLFLIVLSIQSATVAVAADATLSASYLEGKWSESGKQGCTSEHAGYVTFNNNRTLQAGQGKSVSAVGFWDLADDTVIVHLLVSPSTGEGRHPFYQQSYYYQYMAPKMLSIQSDSFDYTHDTGAQAGKKETLTRCR
jgi:hypothetical protein